MAATIGISVYTIYEISNNPGGYIASVFSATGLNEVIQSAARSISSLFYVNFLLEEENEKLLPDWPTAPCYGNVPPGTPAPPLLVLDLEKTLIASTYDARYGWRHVKRPGLDKFIKQLSRYYEIVLFTENDLGVSDQILAAIDPENVCHKLGMTSGEVRGTTNPPTVIKRLDNMNRELSRIILIDDNPDSYQKFPRNTLAVKPFVDVADTSDTVLIDLIPFLQALVHEDVKDFRECFDALGKNIEDGPVHKC